MSKSNGNQQILNLGIIIAITIFIVTVLCLLFNEKETYTSSSNDSQSIGYLNCTTNESSDVFFSSENSLNIKHEIKVTFKSENPDKFSYTFTGEYETNDIAENTDAVFHAKYNNFMANHNLNPNILKPTFSVDNTTLKITLITTASNMNSKVASFFGLNSYNINQLSNISGDELKTLYMEKNFSCNLKK